MKITTHLDHIRESKQHLAQIGRIDGPSEYFIKCSPRLGFTSMQTFRSTFTPRSHCVPLPLGHEKETR